MGLKVDLVCDNCGKDFFAKHINVNEEYTNDVIYAYLDYDLGLKRRNNKN